MEFNIAHIKIKLIQDTNFIWIEQDKNKSYLGHIEMESAKEFLTNNFNTVLSKYKKCIPSFNHLAEFEKNLAEVSLIIVRRFFYIYLNWKNRNHKLQYQDLNFNPKDFNHPYTMDELIAFFKLQYPNDYLDICACILEKTSTEIEKYIIDRDRFYELFK